MIGYNNANKGPLRALEILRGLVEQHKNWRLLLIGDPFPTVPPSTNDQKARNAFYDYILEHNLANNVVEHGYTDNVAKANTEIGYILSLSDREGTHEALLQAMAGSSIPVIRPWEVVSQWGAPETVYAKKWIVTSSSEAVSRILDISADEELRKRLAFEAKQEVFSKYDQSNLIPRLKKLLLT
jgi:glycosyltransferase involved in cell wall biosynthesis